VKRAWFRDPDGTFYRNCPLIRHERDRAAVPWRRAALTDEWWETFRKGVQRKAVLDPGDVVAEPAPFREAYPDRPGLWVLDATGGSP
jgi:hypothetical protein